MIAEKTYSLDNICVEFNNNLQTIYFYTHTDDPICHGADDLSALEETMTYTEEDLAGLKRYGVASCFIHRSDFSPDDTNSPDDINFPEMPDADAAVRYIRLTLFKTHIQHMLPHANNKKTEQRLQSFVDEVEATNGNKLPEKLRLSIDQQIARLDRKDLAGLVPQGQ